MKQVQSSGVLMVFSQAWVEELYHQVLERNMLGEAGYWGSPEEHSLPLITMLTGQCCVMVATNFQTSLRQATIICCFFALRTEQHVVMQHVVFHKIASREGIRLSCGRYLSVCFGSDRKILKHGFKNKLSLETRRVGLFTEPKHLLASILVDLVAVNDRW